MKNSKSGLHPRNEHKLGYDFDVLIQKHSNLKLFVSKNSYGNLSIDFSNPKAVKELNKALLKVYYGIEYWDFPEENLCPPIPGRVDYIHYLNDLLEEKKNVTVLDIGTGATLIYPLLGNSVYTWKFVGTDVSRDSLVSAQKIIDKNQLNSEIELRFQNNEENILSGILKNEDAFDAVMCNPPFYASAREAQGANSRKSRNLGNNAIRNFSGQANELWYKGGEKAFLHNYLYQSSLYKDQFVWFTSLVSNKDNVKSLQKSSEKLKAKNFKIIPMSQGNKITRIVAWQF